MLKPRLLSLGNKKKDFYPSWMIDTLRAAPVTEDRHPGFAESGVKDPSTTVFSIQLYRAILSAEGEKKNKKPHNQLFLRVYYSSCRNESAVSLSFSALSVPLLFSASSLLPRRPSHPTSGLLQARLPTPAHPPKRGPGVWIPREKLYERSGSFCWGREEEAQGRDHPFQTRREKSKAGS